MSAEGLIRDQSHPSGGRGMSASHRKRPTRKHPAESIRMRADWRPNDCWYHRHQTSPTGGTTMRLLAIVAALGSMVGAAAAQDYPTRPINVIVPAAAGGPTDAISRITTQAMS